MIEGFANFGSQNFAQYQNKHNINVWSVLQLYLSFTHKVSESDNSENLDHKEMHRPTDFICLFIFKDLVLAAILFLLSNYKLYREQKGRQFLHSE